MEEIHIALFEVKSASKKILTDSSSQTDLLHFKIDRTPSEYTNYINCYIKEYELIKHNDPKFYEISRSTSNNRSIYSDFYQRRSENADVSRNHLNRFDIHQRSHFCYSSPIPSNSVNRYNLRNNFTNKEGMVDKSTFENKNYNTPQLDAFAIDEYSPSNHLLNYKHYNHKMPIARKDRGNDPSVMSYSFPSEIPRYNFVSTGIYETIAMSLMVGINAIIEVIAGIVINFCPRAPDKDEKFPGTGCVLLDYLNKKIDLLIDNNTDNSGLSKPEGIHPCNSYDLNDGIDWLDKKIDKIFIQPNENSQTVYNRLCEVILEGCYHKDDGNKLDPIKYSKETPFSLPFPTKQQNFLRGGFPNN